jgi:hypothetical protein
MLTPEESTVVDEARVGLKAAALAAHRGAQFESKSVFWFRPYTESDRAILIQAAQDAGEVIRLTGGNLG